jgi:hypothetical protein
VVDCGFRVNREGGERKDPVTTPFRVQEGVWDDGDVVELAGVENGIAAAEGELAGLGDRAGKLQGENIRCEGVLGLEEGEVVGVVLVSLVGVPRRCETEDAVKVALDGEPPAFVRGGVLFEDLRRGLDGADLDSVAGEKAFVDDVPVVDFGGRAVGEVGCR